MISLTPNVRRFLGLDEFDAQQQSAPPDEITAPVQPVDSSAWDAASQPTAGAGGASWAPPAEPQYDPRQYDEGQRETGPAPWTPTSPEGTPAAATVTQPAQPQYDYQIADGRTAPPTPQGQWSEMRTVPKPQPVAQEPQQDEGWLPRTARNVGNTIGEAAQAGGKAWLESVTSLPSVPEMIQAPYFDPIMGQSVRAGQAAQAAASDVIGRRFFEGVGGNPDEEVATLNIPGYGEVKLTKGDLASMGFQFALDPSNAIGAGEAPNVARAAGRAAAPVVREAAQGARGLVDDAAQGATRIWREGRETAARLNAEPGGGVTAAGLGATPENRRFYHGTAGAFERPDPASSERIGIYGPGYYLSDNPELASDYAIKRAQEAARDFDTPTGANVRAVDVPPGVRLMNLDTPVSRADAFRVVSALKQDGDAEGASVVREIISTSRRGEMTGANLFDAIREAGYSDAEVQGVLRRLGYDGLTYNGQASTPLSSGERIAHQETVIFPESLNKIRNGFSGEVGGMSAGALPSSLPSGGALNSANRVLSEGLAGGVGGAVVEQARNPDEDPRTAAARGFAAGAVGFPLATRGIRAGARLAERAGREIDPGLRGAMRAPETGSASGVPERVLEAQRPRALPAPTEQAPARPWSEVSAYLDSPEQAAARAEAARPRSAASAEDAPIREQFGRPWQEVNGMTPGTPDVTGTATRQLLDEGNSWRGPRNLVLPSEKETIGGPVRIEPQSISANAGFGIIPPNRPANQSAAASNDPIMQRMARQMAGQHTPSPIKNVRSLTERWAQAWTDDRAGLRTLQESVAAKIGRPLRADESVAELTRVNPNSIANQRLVEEVGPAWRKVGEDEDYLAQYVTHMHNVDVAREMGQRAYDAAITAGRSPQQASAAAIRAANTRQFSGDLRLNDTLAQLQAIEQRVLSLPDGQQRWQAIKDGAQASWDFNRKTLERKRDAGIIDPALYQELTQRYPHYVRTDIADYFEKGGGGPSPGGKRIGISDIGIQKIGAEGTTKERVNPLLSLIDQAYTSETAIVRNKAGLAFEEMLRLDPDLQTIFKEVVPAQGVNRGNPATTVPTSYTLKNGDQKLTVWQNGQPRQFIVPPEYAALVSPQAGSIFGDSAPVQFLRSAMNAYKALITSKNPAFSMLISPIRDAGDYAIREMTLSAKDQGIKGAGQAVVSLPGVMGDYFRALPDAFAGLTQGQFKGDLATLMREGAGMAGRPGHSQRELRQALDELTRTNGLQVRNLGDLGRILGDVLTLGAEPIGGRLEQVPRLAAARRAERRGAPMLGQVMSARDATVDFQRAGEWARVLNTAIPFFNVAIQSGAQTARTFRKNPAAALASVATAVGVPALAAEVWNHSDEQRARDYEDVPDYLKKTGLVFMLPNVEGVSERGDRLPNYVWLPVGQFGTLLQAAKVTAQNAARDGVSGPEQNSVGGWAKLGADLAAEGFGIFSPIRGESAGAMLSSLVPPGLGTGIELAANKDLFRGSTIATDRRDESASAMAQGSANAFNAVTGMETRPSQWDYLYRDLGGYGATLAGAGSNMLAEAMGMRQPKQEDRPIQSAPVVGGLVNRLVRDAGGQRLENATEDRTRVPEGVQSALDEAGLRRDAVAPVPSKYKGASLTRDEQEQWQQTTNDLIERKVAQAMRSSEWRARGADKEKILRAAVSDAREEAAGRALRRLTDSEIERRKRTDQQRKAS